jgi:hypothetical protein
MSYQDSQVYQDYQAFNELQKATCEPGKPTASLVLGLCGLIAWIIPLFGFPVTITGLVFGIKALGRPQNGMAIAGTVLCGLGLVLTAINSAVGAYLGATGQL